MVIPEPNKEQSLSFIVNQLPCDVSFNDIIDISEELKNINEFYRSCLLIELNQTVLLNCNKNDIENYEDHIFNLWKFLGFYNKKNRFYHNIQHIINCMNTLYNHQDEMLNYISCYCINEIRVALLFHDIIYSPKGKEQKYKTRGTDMLDEELSAELAVKLLQPFFNKNNDGLKYIELHTISELIKSTSHSERYPFDLYKADNQLNNCKAIICDIDLFILSSPEKEFERYRNNVRKEYSFINDDLWKEGSKIFASHFLMERESIYSSPIFTIYEEQARKNLKKLL